MSQPAWLAHVGPADMPGRLGRSLLVLAALVVLAPAAIQPASGAVRTWTLTRSPASIVAGTRATVTLVVTDTGGSGATSQLGCLTVGIPGGFAVSSAVVTAAPAGKTWTASVAGSGPATVSARAATNKGRLVGGARRESVTFRVVVTGRARGAFTWTGTAYNERDCTRALGGSQRLTITVTTAATPEPTARATPRPTPTPRPRPTPTAEPAASAVPTATPTSAATPGVPTATPSPTPAPTARPTPFPSPRPSASPTLAPALPAGPVASGGPPPDEFAVAGTGSGEISIGLGDLGPFASLEWLVPSFVLAVPGLLLVLAIGAQVVGGVVWVPVSRRVLGGRRSRSGRPEARAGRGGAP